METSSSEVPHLPVDFSPSPTHCQTAEPIVDKEEAMLTKEDILSKANRQSLTPATGVVYKAAVWLPRLVFALLLVTAIDLLIFYKTLKTPTFRKVDVFLEPTQDTSSQSDASFAMQGSFTKASLTTSVDSRGAVCDFFYRSNEHDQYSAAGHLTLHLPTDTNTIHDFDIHGDMVKVNYEHLRAMYFDTMSKEVVASQVKIACAIDIAATFWQVIPMENTFHIQQEIFLEPIRKNVEKSKNVFTYAYDKKILEGDDDIVQKPGQEYAKHITVESSLKHMNIYLIQYEVLIRLNKNFKPDESIQSLVLHVPPISYSTAFVDKAGEPKSYLRVNTQPFAVDFAKVPELIDIDMTVSCTPFAVYEGNSKISSTSTGDCTLIAPFDFNRFKTEYKQNGFVNMTTHATDVNFITKFAGLNHYVRTIPPKDEAKKEEAARALVAHRNMQTTDPSISTGSDCVQVDTDGLYFSQACSEIEKGFFYLSINTYNADGYMGYLRSTTSWAPSGPVAFESLLVGSQVDLGDLAARLFFSDAFQNLTLFTTFNYTDGSSFTEQLDSSWDLGVSEGELQVSSFTLLDGFAPVLVGGTLLYADSNYSVAVLVSDKAGQTLGDAATAQGQGRYGGNWYKWWATLDESSLYYDKEYEGAAIGGVHYYVPASGTVGDLTFMAKATDNVHNDYILSNFTGGWFSDQAWTSDGTINMDFYLDIVPEALMVNISSGFHYGEHAYLLAFDMGLNDEPQFVVTHGEGSYGGSWSHFHMDLLNSTLIYAGDVLGHARTSVGFSETHNGAIVGLGGNTQVTDGSNSEVFSSANDLSWFTESSWGNNGNIAVNSLINVNQGAGLNWNVSGKFNFTESTYSIFFHGDNVYSTSAGIVCDGDGTYLMKYYDWTVVLDEFVCASDDVDMGSVSGYTQIISDSMFDTLRVFYQMDMMDGVGEPVIASKQTIQAYPDPPASTDDSTPPTQEIYVSENLYNIDYDTYVVNQTANNEAVLYAARQCLSSATEVVFGPIILGYSPSYAPVNMYYNVYFPASLYSSEYLATEMYNCFFNGYYNTYLQAYVQAHSNASALSVVQVQGYSYPSYSYDDDNNSESPWIYTGHVHIDSFWNMTDVLMWNVSGGLDYSNNSYYAYMREADENQVTKPTTIFAYGKGGYDGSVLDFIITLNESALVYNEGLVGSATGAILGLTTSNGMINFTAAALDANENQVMQTVGQVYWNSESSYESEAKMGVISQLYLSDIMTWNSTAQLEYGSHNYTALFYDSNIYEDSEDVIVAYALGQYGGSFPMDFYTTITHGFVTYNNVLEANVKGRLDVNIADNGTQATMGLQIYDYSTWQYYQQANAYHMDDAYFATNNMISYKYDGDVAEGSLMTQNRYNNAPAFELDTALNVDLLVDAATFSLFDSVYGEPGVNAQASATYDMETGMIASMQAVIYYEDSLIYGFNTDYDMQLENYNNTDGTARPTLMPTPTPSAVPSWTPTAMPTTIKPTSSPTVVPTAMPTASPTTRPSMVPSVSPTPLPTQQPTAVPTAMPTASPTTRAPTALPTVSPSTHPSMVPSVSPTPFPTQQPTAVPTPSPSTTIPTAAPTTIAPSAQPTLLPTTPPDASVEFVASQVISGISYDTYMANKDANDQALKLSIADCMDGISASDITTLTVTAARRLRRLEVVHVDIQASTDSVHSTYTILSTNPALSFDSLSNELATSVTSGKFDEYLNTNAANTPGASTALVTATSTSVTTVNALPPVEDNNDDNQLSGGAIAGIVVSVLFVVALIGAVAYWQLVMKGGPISSPSFASSASQKSQTASVDIEMRPTISHDSADQSSVQWTENVIRKK